VASVLTAALIVVVLSAAIGRAACLLSGWRDTWLAPAAGFGLLLVLGGAVQHLLGDALTAALLTAALAIAALFAWRRAPMPRSLLVDGAIVIAVVLLLSSIPLLASGRAGILGAGNQNDMVQHLTTAHWLESREGNDTVLIQTGYPIGPHGVAAAVADATGMSLVHAFDGVTLAIPVITALAALAALGGIPRAPRLAVASMTALCYLAASYLVTGAFKETAMALFLLAWVLALRELARGAGGRRWTAGVPLGILGAGTIYTYSYLGLGWLLAAGGLFALLELVAAPGHRERLARAVNAAPAAAGAAGTLAVLGASQAGRMADFSQSSFPRQAIGGHGNLLDAISPVQALGVWLRADFRFDMPAVATAAVGVAAGTAALLALVWWLRRRDFALPAGVLSAAFLYWLATEHKNVYNQAKGLAIAAPLVTLMVGAAVAAWSTDSRRSRDSASGTGARHVRMLAVRAGALALLCAAGVSSFLALRDGPVSSDAHASDLAPVRKIVRDQPTLSMDQDDFSHWYLPGIDLGTGPLLYPRRTVSPRHAKKWRATQPFDFDSWAARDLNSFGYVIEPRTKFRSSTPTGFRLVKRTRWFYVWKRTREVRGGRQLIEHGGRPTRRLDCTTTKGRRLARQAGVAAVTARPVVRDWRSWHGQPRRAGQAARLTVQLPRGRWDVSLQYVSTMGLDVRAPGLRTSLPAHLGRIGPYWYVGTVRQRHDGSLRLRLRAREHGLLGRVLGARGFTRAIDVPGNFPLQGVAFTRHGVRTRTVPLHAACGRHVDWYRVRGPGRG
jgi:hypothetical protein